MTGGGNGDDDFAVPWFAIVFKKLSDEIQLLISCAQKVLFPPAKGPRMQRQSAVEQQKSWNNQKSEYKSLLIELLQVGEEDTE